MCLEQLPQLDARIDAWFLDGFAPAKNPHMWTRRAVRAIGASGGARFDDQYLHQHRMGTACVERSRIQMRRTPGNRPQVGNPARTFPGLPESPSTTCEIKPWYARPPQVSAERKALVIGGGLSGCATANSLARRGWQVCCSSATSGWPKEASGNPQGVLYLKLSAHGTTLSQMIVSGFGYTRRLLENLQRGA